ncbi:MAG: hypothetical protein SVZ03_10380 [Spirochaetota bacterium]|nr:hypothetical protein [Spirochaetota bacterium]
MKTPQKKEKENKKIKDDSLWGLLSPYKANHTYFRLLICEEEDNIVLQITDNPKNWLNPMQDKYRSYKQLKRSEIDTVKLSTKYLLPRHLINQIGPTLGMKLPSDKCTIIDNIDEDGCFNIEIPLEFMAEIVQNVKKIINLSPQKKYELLERYLAENSEEKENG